LNRDPKQAEYERAIFDAFLDAYPSFAARVTDVIQPDAAFPDVTTRLKTGGHVEWELKEWLEKEQMAAGKRRECLDAAIQRAIPERPNTTTHILCCMLTPRAGARFDTADTEGFKEELDRLIADVDRRWPDNRAWHSPQGYLCRSFEGYLTLGKYLTEIHFEPRVIAGERREWFAGQPWVFLEAWGGAYDPQQAVDALVALAVEKVSGYGPFGQQDTRLLIFYNRAITYNTPFYGLAYRSFADVAPVVARKLAVIRVPFSLVYLLNALEREACEVYPECHQCS